MSIPAFEFATAQRILFGRGVFDQAAAEASRLGQRVVLVTGASARFADRLRPELEAAGGVVEVIRVEQEPTVASARTAVHKAREFRAEVVMGLGGGRALDMAKALGILVPNPGDALDYLEVIGRGQRFEAASLPVIAIPTTAGPGSEVTRNAVLRDQGVKASLRDPRMLPRLALVDPALTDDLPAGVTASTGLDAATQLLEAFVGVAANPITDAFGREGLTRVARSLRAAVMHPTASARDDMALASVLGGLALANAKLGIVHGVAAALGGATGAAHGEICARMLPAAMKANLAALRARASMHPALARYEEAARILTGRPAARAEDGVAWALQLVDEVGIPRLAALGADGISRGALVEATRRASSTKGNPLPLTAEEIHAMLEDAW